MEKLELGKWYTDRIFVAANKVYVRLPENLLIFVCFVPSSMRKTNNGNLDQKKKDRK